MRLKTPVATHLLSARLEAVCRRFERWRSDSQAPFADTGITLGAALTIAQECGLHRTAQTLRLNYDLLHN